MTVRNCTLLAASVITVPRRSGKRFTSLSNDVSSRIFDVLPDDTWFYPGHGDDSPLGEQRPHPQEWRERGW